MTTGTVPSADGVRIAYDVLGAGRPALVFVHGWSCDRRYWDAQVAHFAERHEVVAVDLAGHGESGLGRRAYTVGAYADDVVSVVEHLNLDRVVLVGHSMGGDVATLAALRLAGRVVGVVWGDTYRSLRAEPEPEPGAVAAELAPFEEDFRGTVLSQVRAMFLPRCDETLREQVAADMASAPPEVAVDTLRHLVGEAEAEVVAALPKLTAPVVALNTGERQNDADNLRAHGVRLVELAGVGHFLMLEDPAGFNRLLTGLVAEFAAAAQAR